MLSNFIERNPFKGLTVSAYQKVSALKFFEIVPLSKANAFISDLTFERLTGEILGSNAHPCLPVVDLVLYLAIFQRTR